MAKKLNTTVWVRNESGDGGDLYVAFGPDSGSIPKWAADQIGPHAYADSSGNDDGPGADLAAKALPASASKAEMSEQAAELGLSTDGTKDEIRARIVEHFDS